MADKLELPIKVDAGSADGVNALRGAVSGLGGDTANLDQKLKTMDSDMAALRSQIDQLSKSSHSAASAHKQHTHEVEEGNEKFKEARKLVQEYGEALSQHMINPMGGVTAGLGFLSNTIGTTSAAVGLGVAGLAVFAKQAYETAEAQGKFAVELSNTSIRTGLATESVAQLMQVTKMAGTDITVVERAMRGLSQAMSDGSDEGKKAKKALQDLGVSLTDTMGNEKNFLSAFTEIGEKLKAMQSPFERARDAQNLFGRSGIELLPTLQKLPELMEMVQRAGIGQTWQKENTEKTEAMNEKLEIALARWKELRDQLAQKIVVPAFSWLMDQEAGAFQSVRLLIGKDGKPISTMAEDTERDLAEEAAERNRPRLEAGKHAAEDFLKQHRANSIDQQEELTRDARKRATEARAKVESYASGEAGIDPDVERKAEQAASQADAEAKKQEDRLKAMRKAEGDPDRLKELTKSVNESELQGLDKIAYARQFALEQLGKSASAQEKINALFAEQERHEKTLENIELTRAALQGKIRDIQTTAKPGEERETAKKIEDLKLAQAQAEYAERAKFSPSYAQFELGKNTLGITDEYRAAIQAQDKKDAERTAQAQLRELTRQSAADSRELETNARPGNEESTIEAAYRLRLEYADKEKTINRNKVDSIDAYESQVEAAKDEREQRYAELRKKRDEEQRQRAVQMVRDTEAFQIKKLGADTGEGSEADQYQKIADIRVQAAKAEYAITKDRLELERNVQEALIEQQDQEMQYRHAQIVQDRQLAAGIFEGLVTANHGGLRKWGEEQLHSIESQVFQNLASPYISKITGSVAAITSGSQYDAAGNKTLFGRAVSGTLLSSQPGFADHKPLSPEEISAQTKAIVDKTTGTHIDANTSAVSACTQALLALASQLGYVARPSASNPTSYGGVPSYSGGMVPLALPSFSSGGGGGGSYSPALPDLGDSGTPFAGAGGFGDLAFGDGGSPVLPLIPNFGLFGGGGGSDDSGGYGMYAMDDLNSDADVTSPFAGALGYAGGGGSPSDAAMPNLSDLVADTAALPTTGLGQVTDLPSTSWSMPGDNGAPTSTAMQAVSRTSAFMQSVNGFAKLPAVGGNTLGNSLSQIPQVLSMLGGGANNGSNLSTFAAGMGTTNDWQGAFTGTRTNADGSSESLSGAQQAGEVTGMATDALGGALAALSDFKKGGVRGDANGIGQIATTALSMDPDPTGISQAVLGVVKLGSSLISLFAGDPVEERHKQIREELADNKYLDPDSLNISADMYSGGIVDTNEDGKSRVSNYNAFRNFNVAPSLQRSYLAPHDKIPIPGYQLDPFVDSNLLPGATSSSANPLPSNASAASAINPAEAAQPQSQAGHTFNFHFLDAKSLMDRRDDITDAVLSSTRSNHPFGDEIRRQAQS